MIYQKDDGDGKAFWKAATADRVILPNGEEAEPTGWYLDREIARVRRN